MIIFSRSIEIKGKIVTLLIFETKEKMMEYRKEKGDPKCFTDAAICFNDSNDKEFATILIYHEKITINPGVLFHEAVHFAYKFVKVNRYILEEVIDNYGKEEVIAKSIEKVSEFLLSSLMLYRAEIGVPTNAILH